MTLWGIVNDSNDDINNVNIAKNIILFALFVDAAMLLIMFMLMTKTGLVYHLLHYVAPNLVILRQKLCLSPSWR
jgi:hypothetical protein